MPVCWFCSGLDQDCTYCGGGAAGDDPEGSASASRTTSSNAPAKPIIQEEWVAPDGNGELKPVTGVYSGSNPLLVEVGGIFAPVAGSGASSFDALRQPISVLPTKVSEALLKSTEALTCVRWMMQKVALRQDILLLGDFGPTARHLALILCQLLQKKFEYLALSRDTTEADLTERVELVAASEGEGENESVSSVMRPAVPVRAARAGHFLILENVDRAERNVLSALNNLLENRELPLRAGLLSRKGEGDLRVSPDFLVIAIATPAKRYPQSGVGTLDPPLRSRLAAYPVPQIIKPDVSEQLRKVLIAMEPLRSTLAGDYPTSSDLTSAATESAAFQNLDLAAVLRTAWPYEYFLTPKQITDVNNALAKMPNIGRPDPYRVSQLSVGKDGVVNLTFAGSAKRYNACRGSHKAPAAGGIDHSKEPAMLGTLLRDHCLDRDVLLLGHRGCGKTSLIHRFADMLGYRCRTIYCTAETDARDLTLRRVISPGGSTTYEATPVVEAALAGDILVLDGIERLPVGLLHSVLAQLLQDRTLELVDGRRFLPSAVLDDGASVLDEATLRIHPSFRVIATGCLSSHVPLDPSVRSLFGAVRILPWTPVADPLKALNALSSSSTSAEALLAYSARSRELASQNPGDFAPYALTWRQILAAVQRETENSGTGLYDAVLRCFAARLRFTVPHVRAEVEKMLEEAVGQPAKAPRMSTSGLTITEGMVHIGNVACPRGGDLVDEADEESVSLEDSAAPSPASFGRHGAAFVDVPQHLEVLQGMLAEWTLGRHLLLIGPQGVGKNRLADRLCEMLGRRREYVQLHRDTTVARMTRAAVLEAGRVTFRDSALLKAAALGRVLVVDEVDKAPLEVACVLRALADDALDLGLPDGRRLMARGVISGGVLQNNDGSSEGDIVVHENFRMILLANPPGHPFKGTDFFGECGDVFSGFAVEPLESQSERELLHLVAPRVPKHVIEDLIRLSSTLQQAYHSGALNYPYSIREILQIARHLDVFPLDPLQEVVQDVFAFDVKDESRWKVLQSCLKTALESKESQASNYPEPARFSVKKAKSKENQIVLEFEQAWEMQDLLIKEYSTTEFQRALHQALAGKEKDPTATVVARSEVCTPIQAKIIPRYGFTPDKKGVLGSLRSFKNPELWKHPRAQELTEQSDMLGFLVNPSFQDAAWLAKHGLAEGAEGADGGPLIKFWALPVQ